ncbi:hypothetical protein POJ06DRAFT_251915 [Lipomyces tetrasporus]|uniref:Uncharacterized protein n=1 Tax=Lipomyces tetrasporus TaxID=54092 RepID=A0AAD7QU76_9ASCO|nr:uncharacterized protein POJ06DRAFT_251915 [Lipomyces tetrasporus]KAJ8101593.1 hypothetical protein POJ06DRAFT_251915 [Lipomyces tetrasporus]
MDPDDEDLIPPTLSITLPPIPLSSRPPTKEDVDRAEYLMNMVKSTLSGKHTVMCECVDTSPLSGFL